jgi:VIT1/CCC1 family predicted Fe2+/Mn2+ transporter
MSISKRLEEARSGYKKGDKSLSAKAHDIEAIRKAAREHHGGAGSAYLGDLVYGGLDGIITTFAVVSGVAGARLDASVILILGLANLFADGVSMATGAYLSEKSDQEYYERERQREAWEVDNFPEGERAELEELYVSQGYTEQDARTMVDIKSKDKKLWIDAMMIEELGMLKEEKKPLLSAAATLVAFIVAGSVPLLVYLLDLLTPISASFSFPVAIVLSGVALFGLGAAKVLVTQRSWVKSGVEMLVVGGLAASVAYIVGVLLRGIGG